MKTLAKVFWLFGRSGAGITTLARRLQQKLSSRQVPVVYLDGDDLRATLCSDLGFQPEARLKNHRRIAEVARLLADQDLNGVVATMAPGQAQRDLVARVLGDKLVWIYVDAPLEVCMARDPKGIYKLAQAGRLQQLIDYPFDTPRPHEGAIQINTFAHNVGECFGAILSAVRRQLSAFVT